MRVGGPVRLLLVRLGFDKRVQDILPIGTTSLSHLSFHSRLLSFYRSVLVCPWPQCRHLEAVEGSARLEHPFWGCIPLLAALLSLQLRMWLFLIELKG